MTEPIPLFSFQEVEAITANLDDDARRIVLDGLRLRAETKLQESRLQEQERQTRQFKTFVSMYAATVERNANPIASASNFEGWWAYECIAAQTLLLVAPDRPSMSPGESLARELAAITYIQHTIEEGEEEEYIISANQIDKVAITETFENSDTATWAEYVRGKCRIMRQTLLSEGYALPELNESGEYSEAEDDMIYSHIMCRD